MITVSIDEKNAVEKTIGVIASGGLAVLPTDTVYGIVGDATKEHVILNLFLFKKRSKKKPFSIFVRDITMARRYAYISDSKAKFLEKIWPGGIIALMHHKEKLPSVLTAGGDSIGIRIPDHPFLREILSHIDYPLIQTSANFSGDTPACDGKDAKNYFQRLKIKPELIIDGGKTFRATSAVIDLTKEIPLILRTGLMSKRELDRMFERFYTT